MRLCMSIWNELTFNVEHIEHMPSFLPLSEIRTWNINAIIAFLKFHPISFNVITIQFIWCLPTSIWFIHIFTVLCVLRISMCVCYFLVHFLIRCPWSCVRSFEINHNSVRLPTTIHHIFYGLYGIRKIVKAVRRYFCVAIDTMTEIDLAYEIVSYQFIFTTNYSSFCIIHQLFEKLPKCSGNLSMCARSTIFVYCYAELAIVALCVHLLHSMFECEIFMVKLLEWPQHSFWSLIEMRNEKETIKCYRFDDRKTNVLLHNHKKFIFFPHLNDELCWIIVYKIIIYYVMKCMANAHRHALMIPLNFV